MIDLFKPYMGNEELESLRDIFKSGWVGLGPMHPGLTNEEVDTVIEAVNSFHK